MSFLGRIGEKFGITSRPATAEEVAEINALRTAQPATEAAPQAYAYQEYEPGFGYKRKPRAEDKAKPNLFSMMRDRFPKSQTPASEQIIDQKPETPSTLQKWRSSISSAVSGAAESISSKFKQDDTLQLTRSMMLDREPSLWDRVKEAGRSVRESVGPSLNEGIKAAGPSFSQGVKASGPSFSQGAKDAGRIVSQSIANAAASLRSATSRTASTVASLPARVAATGRDLANPDTRRECALALAKATGKTLAVAGSNMALVGGVKLAAGAALAGTGAGATIVGLALATGTVKGLLDSRRQYHNTLDEDQKGNIKGYWKHVFNNKAQLAKNIGIKTAVSAALGGVAGYFLADHILDQASAVKPTIDPTLVTDADQIAELSSIPETPVYQAPSALNEAISWIEKRPTHFPADIQSTIELAKQGDAAALEKLAHAIDMDGTRADDHLVKPLLDEAARQADATATAAVPAPAPVTTVTSAPVAPAVTPNTHLLDDVMSSIKDAAESEEARNVLIATGGGTAAGVATVVGVNALPALAIATAEPKMDNAPPRIAQICQMRDTENANQIGLRCPETPAFVQIRPGDTLRIQYTDNAKNISSSIDIRNPAAAIATKDYEAAMANDGSFMSSVREQLRGYISEKFNRANATDISAPIAANENEVPPDVTNDNTAPATTEELPPVAAIEPQTFKEVFAKWTMEQTQPAPAIKITPTYSTNLFDGKAPVNDDVLAQTGQMTLSDAAPR